MVPGEGIVFGSLRTPNQTTYLVVRETSLNGSCLDFITEKERQ
jgi:hypothetical protein